MMNGRRIVRAGAAGLVLAVAACGSDGDSATAVSTPVVLALEGVVQSDAWGAPIAEPVLIRVFRPDARGGWNEAVPDEEGRYAVQIELRDGCEAGTPLEATVAVAARDHRTVLEDFGQGRTVVCDPEPQTLDVTLYKERFRTPVAVAGELAASQVAAYARGCAVTPEGALCWGGGEPAPVAVPGGETFGFVAVAPAHECALDEEAAAWCWGSNPNGALGVPGLTESAAPVAVETDLRFQEVATNHESSCGLGADGRLHCWGLYGGETPVAFGGDLRFEQISGQYQHMCGVDDQGDVHCWGNDVRGETGRDERGRAEEPVRVTDTGDVRAVSAGVQTSCAVTEGGAGYCWGWNCHGQLGSFNQGMSDSASPVEVEQVPHLVSVTAGLGFGCGVTEDGEAWCWGRNDHGQLGSETELRTATHEPVQVSGDVRFASLAAGSGSACGVSTEGGVYCWGRRANLGTGLPLEGAGDGPWSASQLTAGLEVGESCPRG